MGVVYTLLHSMVLEERNYGCRLSATDYHETMLPQLRKS